jgi:hypothetical protein
MENLGIYAVAKIKSLDITTEGSNNTAKWGNSLKIKVELPSSKIKKVGGEEIEFESETIAIFKIKFQDEQKMLKKFKELQSKIGQNMKFKFSPKIADGDNFWADFAEQSDKKAG